MRRPSVPVRLAAVLLMLGGLPFATARAEQRVALVIGMSAYRHTAVLTNPANDARDMGVALRDLGFTVQEAIDLDKRALDDAVRGFADSIAASDVALVFFAGHGIQVGRQNYLLPVDARLAAERDLDFEALSLDFLLRQLETGREGKASLIFLDACRDNPLVRNFARARGVRAAALERGLAAMDSGAGTFIAFATQPGNAARDGLGRNSPFTTALLHHVRNTPKGLGALMIDVRNDVMAATQGGQVPWDHSALTRDFFFQRTSGIVSGSIGSPDRAATDADLRAERMRRLEEELGQSRQGPRGE